MFVEWEGVGLDKWWLRIILIISGVPIAVIINAFRIATLGILSLEGQDYMVGQFHSFIGLVWMIPTFGLYMLTLWFLQPLSENADGSSTGGVGSSEQRKIHSTRFDRRVVMACCGTMFLLVIGGAGLRIGMNALDRYLIKEPVPPRTALASLGVPLAAAQSNRDTLFQSAVVEMMEQLTVKCSTGEGNGTKFVQSKCNVEPESSQLHGPKAEHKLGPRSLEWDMAMFLGRVGRELKKSGGRMA